MGDTLKQPSGYEALRSKLFEIKYAEALGVAGPGQIPIDKIRDLNGLVLPIVREEIVHDREDPRLVRAHTVVLQPDAIAHAYGEQGINESAKWWQGYAAATVTFEDGSPRRGEIAMDVRAGICLEPQQDTSGN